ncbi:MAG: arsenate reductase family protein [Clostridia bacterium]|nr:arsenate reductase family protein [Clostridia bacterium]
MTPVLICYAKCTTCQKAKKWLESQDIAFEERPIKEQNPTETELRAWRERSGLPLRRFFNTSGMLYRDMELSKKLPDMTEEDMLRLLASDGMLVKRPLLISDRQVLVGFREAEWTQALKK